MEQRAISEIIIVKLIIVALILFAVLWALKFAWKNVPVRRTLKTKINRIIPLAEGVVWFSFLFWCIRQLFFNEFWNSIGVLVLVLMVTALLSWFVARDYIAGIILKSDGSMRLNDWIKIKGVEGKITQMGQRAMIITANSGETMNIPYSALAGEISIKPNPSEKLISHTFEMEISRNTDLEATIKQIRSTILNAPWASVRKIPEIKLLRDSPEVYIFEISIYTIRLVYFQKIKEYLKSHLHVLFLQKSGK